MVIEYRLTTVFSSFAVWSLKDWDYSPLDSPGMTFWSKVCFAGKRKAMEKELTKRPKLLERRESLLRASGIHHVVIGARSLHQERYAYRRILHQDSAGPESRYLDCLKFLVSKGA